MEKLSVNNVFIRYHYVIFLTESIDIMTHSRNWNRVTPFSFNLGDTLHIYSFEIYHHSFLNNGTISASGLYKIIKRRNGKYPSKTVNVKGVPKQSYLTYPKRYFQAGIISTVLSFSFRVFSSSIEYYFMATARYWTYAG